MGLLRRLFGPASESPVPETREADGHVHAPDAGPDDVVLPKEKRSSRSLLAGQPPTGWRRQASEATGGIWPWSGGESTSDHHFGGGGESGGGSGGGD